MAMTSLPLLLEARDPRAASGGAPADVLTELQAVGARWLAAEGTGLSRIGGAGPSDHKAMTYAGQTVMVPIHTSAAKRSPFSVRSLDGGGHVLERDGLRLGSVTFPEPPRFYGGQTRDGVPYWKIAQLHSTNVLATTGLTCSAGVASSKFAAKIASDVNKPDAQPQCRSAPVPPRRDRRPATCTIWSSMKGVATRCPSSSRRSCSLVRRTPW